MLSNYLKIALRNLRKQKLYTAINIIGLSVGIAGSLLISWYVVDELSYDDFHQDAEQVFRVTTHWGDDPQTDIYATTPPPLRNRILEEIPEVEEVARAFSWNHSTMRLPKNENGEESEVIFRETRIYIVDPNFLKVMDFNLIAGDAETAFQDLESIVITKATAVRYFGEEALEKNEVIGKTILFGGSQTARYVTAIVDPPAQTHFPFDMLVNVQFGYREIAEANIWSWNTLHTYVKVNPAVTEDEQRFAALEEKLQAIADNYGKAFMQQEGNGPDAENMTFAYRLQAVTDIHLHSNYLREHVPNGNISTVYSLSAIALFILLLACINFMNLATAQSARRAKEVGIRKVLGSSRKYLVGQFLSEAMIFTLIAAMLALGLIEIIRLPFNTLSGKELTFDWAANIDLLLAFGIAVLLIGLGAGSYPAFYLSAFRPGEVLKGKLTGGGKSNRLRNGLVTFQFIIAITLITCTLLVVQQLRYMQQKELGFDQENVLVIQNDREVREQWQEFKQTLERQPQVISASFATGMPAQPLLHMRDFREEGTDMGQGINWMLIDEQYISTLALTLAEGRGFEQERQSDNRQGLLLNEAAVRVLGLKDPIGKILIKNQGAEDEERLQVIGVVKNFHVESLQNQVKPLAFQYYQPDLLGDYVAVRLAPGKVAESVQQVEEVWKQFEPENPFVYSFLDQDFDTLFRAEQRLGKVLSLFTGLAILIACLGLVALAAFMAERRTKEIGIRKVLGASAASIVSLLSSDFMKLIALASLIAIPLAYLLIRQWLQNFAYQTEISVWIFILAGGSALLIALLTVSWQAVKAALANPVDSLRDE